MFRIHHSIVKISSMISGVSLGPGDADLITVKGLKTLQNADVIYFPGSLFANGQKLSYSETILKQLDIDLHKCVGFYLEMSDDRTQANSIYDTTAENIVKDAKEGKHVAIVSEGDLNTFSSFSYLLKRLKAKDLSVNLIPGITSYALAAAQANLPLTLLNDTMLVLPRVASEDMLSEAINSNSTVVLMKIKSVIDTIDTVLKNNKVSFVYAERLGTEQEFITSNWEEVKKRTIPYFSLMIVQK